jgi:hypothetical protein
MPLLPLLAARTVYDDAITRLLGSRSAGDTFTHPADFIMAYTITTVPSAGGINVEFRYQDATNYWMVQVWNDGTFKLFDRVAGTFTQRAIAAGGGVVSAGMQIVVAANDETITGYYGTTQGWTYTSAASFKTETDANVDSLGTGGVLSDLYLWPYSAGTLAELTA